MRGVKLSLQDNGGSDHVWLDESQLSASCWMPAHPERILCPGFVVGPDGSRMTLGAYGALNRGFSGWV